MAITLQNVYTRARIKTESRNRKRQEHTCVHKQLSVSAHGNTDDTAEIGRWIKDAVNLVLNPNTSKKEIKSRLSA